MITNPLHIRRLTGAIRSYTDTVTCVIAQHVALSQLKDTDSFPKSVLNIKDLPVHARRFSGAPLVVGKRYRIPEYNDKPYDS